MPHLHVVIRCKLNSQYKKYIYDIRLILIMYSYCIRQRRALRKMLTASKTCCISESTANNRHMHVFFLVNKAWKNSRPTFDLRSCDDDTLGHVTKQSNAYRQRHENCVQRGFEKFLFAVLSLDGRREEVLELLVAPPWSPKVLLSPSIQNRPHHFSHSIYGLLQ